VTDLLLDPCPFCSCQDVGIDDIDQHTFAVFCRACGAQGPTRTAGPAQLDKYVQAQAADDWNRRSDAVQVAAVEGPKIDLSPTRPSANGISLSHPTGDRTAKSPGGGSDKATKPKKTGKERQLEGRKKFNPHSEGFKPAKGTKETSALQQVVETRLRDWLSAEGLSVNSAVERYGKALGASNFTLYTLLQGKQLSQASLDKINAALDKLETKARPAIEVLPNKLAAVTGITPLPKLAPPPRHASSL